MTKPKEDEVTKPVKLPICKKCGKTPLGCKFPNDCGLENLK